MNWKEKVAQLSGTPVVATYDNNYIEKLASACEYAAANFETDITRNKYAAQQGSNTPFVPEQSYVQAQPVASGASDFLLHQLKEKIAKKQDAFIADDQSRSNQVVQNILARLQNTPNETTEVIETIEQYAPVETSQIDDLVAMPNTSLVDVLEAAQQAATSHSTGLQETRTANGTSTSQELPVKTAGARGKGPEAIGVAANRLRDKLLQVVDKRG